VGWLEVVRDADDHMVDCTHPDNVGWLESSAVWQCASTHPENVGWLEQAGVLLRQLPHPENVGWLEIAPVRVSSCIHPEIVGWLERHARGAEELHSPPGWLELHEGAGGEIAHCTHSPRNVGWIYRCLAKPEKAQNSALPMMSSTVGGNKAKPPPSLSSKKRAS
jgi:hypothetical protein